MPRYYAVALKDLKLARVAYERDEPRDLDAHAIEEYFALGYVPR